MERGDRPAPIDGESMGQIGLIDVPGCYVVEAPSHPIRIVSL